MPPLYVPVIFHAVFSYCVLGEDWIRIHHDGNLTDGQRARIQETLSLVADQTSVKEEGLVADVITE